MIKRCDECRNWGRNGEGEFLGRCGVLLPWWADGDTETCDDDGDGCDMWFPLAPPDPVDSIGE